MITLKKNKILITLLSTVMLCGCASTKPANTVETEVEYGISTDINYADLLKYEKDTIISTDITPDINQVGKHTVNVQKSKKYDDKKQHDTVIVSVVDTKKPKISTNIDTKEVFEVEYGSKFNLKDHLNKIIKDVTDENSDKITDIKVVDEKIFKKIEDGSKTLSLKLKEREITKDKKAEEIKDENIIPGTLYAYSNVNPKKEGTYSVNLVAVDDNYISSSLSYKVKVLKKGKKVDNKIEESNSKDKSTDKKADNSTSSDKNTENYGKNDSSPSNSGSGSSNSGNSGNSSGSSSSSGGNSGSSGGNSTDNKPVNPPTPPADITDVTGYAEEVMSYINNYRAQNGLNALQYNGNVQYFANLRVQELLSNFSHSTGYDIRSVTGLEPCGENIAQGTSPSGTFNAWKNSSGHNYNMLHPLAVYGSIGVVKNSYGQVYWVLVTTRDVAAESGWE